MYRNIMITGAIILALILFKSLLKNKYIKIIMQILIFAGLSWLLYLLLIYGYEKALQLWASMKK